VLIADQQRCSWNAIVVAILGSDVQATLDADVSPGYIGPRHHRPQPQGGVGKTYTAWRLASVAEDRGQRLLAIDSDHQGSSAWNRELLAPVPTERP